MNCSIGTNFFLTLSMLLGFANCCGKAVWQFPAGQMNRQEGTVDRRASYCERLIDTGSVKVRQISFSPMPQCDQSVRYLNYISGRKTVIEFLKAWGAGLRPSVVGFCQRQGQRELASAISAGLQPISIHLDRKASLVVLYFEVEGFNYEVGLSMKGFSPRSLEFWQ